MSLSPYTPTLATGARASATTETYDIVPGNRRGIILITDVTVGASYSQTVSILGVDAVSGQTWVILAAAAQSTVSTQILRVAPGLVAVTNLVANDILPATIRISITHTNANSLTRTIAAQLVA